MLALTPFTWWPLCLWDLKMGQQFCRNLRGHGKLLGAYLDDLTVVHFLGVLSNGADHCSQMIIPPLTSDLDSFKDSHSELSVSEASLLAGAVDQGTAGALQQQQQQQKPPQSAPAQRPRSQPEERRRPPAVSPLRVSPGTARR